MHVSRDLTPHLVAARVVGSILCLGVVAFLDFGIVFMNGDSGSWPPNLPTYGEYDLFALGSAALAAASYLGARVVRPTAQVASGPRLLVAMLLAVALAAASNALWLWSTSPGVGNVEPVLGIAAIVSLAAGAGSVAVVGLARPDD